LGWDKRCQRLLISTSTPVTLRRFRGAVISVQINFKLKTFCFIIFPFKLVVLNKVTYWAIVVWAIMVWAIMVWVDNGLSLNGPSYNGLAQ